MLTAGDVLAKTLAKSQKVTFWSQKNGFGCFFFLFTAVDALRASTAVSQTREPKPFLAVLTKNSAPAVEPKLQLKNGGCTVISQNQWNIAYHCYQPNS